MRLLLLVVLLSLSTCAFAKEKKKEDLCAESDKKCHVAAYGAKAEIKFWG